MILTIENGAVFNDEGTKVAVLTREGDTPEVRRVIEFGSEAAPAITAFVEKVNHGKFTPRTAVKEFEEIIKKYQA